MRVDVNSSRSFDLSSHFDYFTKTLDHDNFAGDFNERLQQFYYSRTPSVLSIKPPDESINKYDIITIIKSPMKNTILKQPRFHLNEFLKDKDWAKPLFEKKYLKYKKKYLQKKIIMNNS